MQELISIIIPMYFEEEVATECYSRLTAMARMAGLNYELIFINDGSTDKTLAMLECFAKEDIRVKVISFARNFGHQIAVSAGIDKAKGEAVVIIDADLQDPPELIPKMIQLWKDGYDVIYAKRNARDGETWFKLLTSKIFYRVLNKMTNVVIPLDTGDFRLIDRKVVEVFKGMPEKNRFVRGMVSWLGFKQIPIEYERHERFAGKTKYPLKKMLKFAADGILSFSAKPLKLIEYMGFWTILASLGLFIYSLISRIIGSQSMISGWISIITGITFFGGIQLLSIGILGEYVSRIYDESKGRPLYVIEKEINTNYDGEYEKNNENDFKETVLKII